MEDKIVKIINEMAEYLNVAQMEKAARGAVADVF